MNDSINYSGFVDMVLDSSDDYEPYGYDDIEDSLEDIYNSIQDYKGGYIDSN